MITNVTNKNDYNIRASKLTNVYEVVEKMLSNAMNGKIATYVCFYDEAVEALQHLFEEQDVKIADVQIEASDLDGYDLEYYICLDEDFDLYICKGFGQKEYGYKEDRYLGHDTDVLYIMQDCSVDILDYISAYEINVVNFPPEEIEEEVEEE